MLNSPATFSVATREKDRASMHIIVVEYVREHGQEFFVFREFLDDRYKRFSRISIEQLLNARVSI